MVLFTERIGRSYLTRRIHKDGVDAVGVRKTHIKMERQSVGILEREVR